jgi:hypothetical protein
MWYTPRILPFILAMNISIQGKTVGVFVAPPASHSIRLYGTSFPVWRCRIKGRLSQLAWLACAWRLGQPWSFEPCAKWSRRSRSCLSPESTPRRTRRCRSFAVPSKKDRPKPFSQRRSRLMEDGPRGEGGLVASCLARIKVASAMKICMMVLIRS